MFDKTVIIKYGNHNEQVFTTDCRTILNALFLTYADCMNWIDNSYTNIIEQQPEIRKLKEIIENSEKDVIILDDNNFGCDNIYEILTGLYMRFSIATYNN